MLVILVVNCEFNFGVVFVDDCLFCSCIYDIVGGVEVEENGVGIV